MLNKKSRYLLITILVFLSIAFDQISKIWVRNNFESYSEKSIIGDVFTLIKVENTGAFLGMGSELSEIPRILLLIILPVIVLISITLYTYIDKSLDKLSIIGFSLIIGGGIANIFDRIVFGSVTDFLYINLGGIFKTGIFNIADLSVTTGMILLSLVVILYVASGGLRAVAYVDTMQCILLAGGIIVLGVITLSYLGGFSNLIEGIAVLSQADTKLTKEGYSHYVAIPGMIQFVDAGSKAIGGPWTGIMILTYMFALMGIQSAPAFTMWAFSNQSPKPFAPQQVWASAFGIGAILFVFTAVQGLSLIHI
mgnify:CR=1 FL=1